MQWRCSRQRQAALLSHLQAVAALCERVRHCATSHHESAQLQLPIASCCTSCALVSRKMDTAKQHCTGGSMHHWHTQGLHIKACTLWQSCVLQVTKTGEVLMVLGGADGWGPELIGKAQMAALLQRVEAEMKLLEVDVTVLRQRSVPSNTSATGGACRDLSGCPSGSSCSPVCPVILVAGWPRAKSGVSQRMLLSQRGVCCEDAALAVQLLSDPGGLSKAHRACMTCPAAQEGGCTGCLSLSLARAACSAAQHPRWAWR